MRHVKTLLVLGLPLILAACDVDYTNKSPLRATYGNATYHNLSMQIIDPAPNLEGREVPDMNAIRAADAIDRYETGTVFEPEAIETSDVIGD